MDLLKVDSETEVRPLVEDSEVDVELVDSEDVSELLEDVSEAEQCCLTAKVAWSS